MEYGKVAKYVTDFPNDNMVGRENVILLPHLGASTAEAEDNCAVMAVDEIRSYFENGNIINSVNFPRLDMGELGSGIRVAVMIKDVADPALSVMEMLSAAKINYFRVMASRREDGISYVLAEITQESIPSLLFYGEGRMPNHQLPCNRKITKKYEGDCRFNGKYPTVRAQSLLYRIASHGSVLFTRPEIAFTRRRLLQKGDSCI